MILLYAVGLGLVAGFGRALIGRHPYSLPEFRGVWLLFVAFATQWVVLSLPQTRTLFSLQAVAAALVGSQVLLLIFVWLNRQNPAFLLMGAGLLCNAAVIVLNGGLMPISPVTAQRLEPELPAELWKLGTRFGYSKDIILAPEHTRLVWLSDRFITPAWLPQHAAYSIGDVLIAAGAFWLLWRGGSAPAQSGSSALPPLTGDQAG